jgi:hypothetical protein
MIARLLRDVRAWLAAHLAPDQERYEPSRHYMRGPGPKTLAKSRASE